MQKRFKFGCITYISKLANRELELSEEALRELVRQSGLASVDYEDSLDDSNVCID